MRFGYPDKGSRKSRAKMKALAGSLVFRLCRHDQHGTTPPSQDFIRDAADQHARQSAPAMRRHDDQVDSFFFGAVDDGAEGLASIDHLAHFQSDARIGDFLGDEFLKFHRSVSRNFDFFLDAKGGVLLVKRSHRTL